MKEPTTTNLDEIVPGRLTSAELKAMALRQQQQIDTQHLLLATKEQRLRFLKSQEVRNAVANAEGERLRRLRERVEAQESKLRRLRALRGQVDLQKTYNVTLSNDLDSIRALFSEKEKELSLAVAKVEALTRQLEDLRRDRRCPINLLTGTQSANGTTSAAQNMPPQASRELEKLRRELMYRNQLSLQQDARLHLQREALQQRQAELRSVDQRIFELQTRLQRKKAANVQITNNQQQQQQQQQQQILLQQQQQQQQQQQIINQQKQQQYNEALALQNTLAKQGVAALKQQLLQKQANHIAAAVVAASQQQQQQQQQQQVGSKFSNLINREQNRNVPRNNVAAVEPYIHAPQKSSITSTASFLSGNGGNILKHAATANTNQQNQLIQDLTHVKLSLATSNVSTAPATTINGNNVTTTHYFAGGESDETKLAKKMLTASLSLNKANETSAKACEQTDSSQHIYAEVGPKKRDLLKEVETSTANVNALPGSKIPKSILTTTTATALISKLNSATASATTTTTSSTTTTTTMEDNREQLGEKKSAQQLTVHSMPLGVANKSVATGVATTTTTTATTTTTTSHSGNSNLAVPPRKPISSVAPTSVMSSIPKMKVNRVAPHMVSSSSATTVSTSAIQTQKMTPQIALQTERPALPPKPIKMPASESTQVDGAVNRQKPATQINDNNVHFGLQNLNINDNLPIKAKPLTIRKQPMSEQPRLKSTNAATKANTQQNARKLDMPSATAFLFPDTKRNSPEQKSSSTTQEKRAFSPTHSNQSSPKSQTSLEDSEKLAEQINNSTNSSSSSSSSDSACTDSKRRARGSLSTSNNSSTGNGTKPKLARRVSFDPLALLLDASLEGELELVKKTAMQVANPSAANDEGITALHNAICAGHFDIVKFLVEFGCDVNAQDSDGWTPLHCAASCNNLAMVKFLVESGACLFAQTLSDHETPAEKCEEDEEGFDGCSEYLYSIQEKLGILHGGEVYAVFSYEAQNSDELTFNVNDRLKILRKGDDAESEWWWAKNANDMEGYVPRNLLGLYPRVPPQITDFKD